MIEQDEQYLIQRRTLRRNTVGLKADEENIPGGLDDHIRNLQEFLNEALITSRIAVIGSIPNDIKHNKGELGSYPWSRYVDLDKTEIYKKCQDGTLKKSLSLRWISEQDFFNKVSIRQDEIREVNEGPVDDEKNKQYKILVVSKSQRSNFQSPIKYYVQLIPSRRVDHLTDTVLHRFGTNRAAMQEAKNLLSNHHSISQLWEKIQHEKFFYCCLHIRAGDMFLHRLYDFYSTRPRHIKKLVYSACPRGTKLYIMSDIANSKYFDFLRTRYEVYRYYDFPELKQLISGENDFIDNNLLFSVEKNIMHHALVQIRQWFRNVPYFQSDFLYTIPMISRLHFYIVRRIKGMESVGIREQLRREYNYLKKL